MKAEKKVKTNEQKEKGIIKGNRSDLDKR